MAGADAALVLPEGHVQDRTRGSEFPLSWRLCTICSRARASADLPFRSAEQSEARPAAARGVGKGTLWVGRGVVSPATSPLPSPLVVLHGSGDVHFRMLLTDTPPERTGATLYACRDWIEQNFRGPGAPAGCGSACVRTGPVRAGWHWLVMALAALLAVAYGTRWEEAATLGRTPRSSARPRRPSRPCRFLVPQPPTPEPGLSGSPADPGGGGGRGAVRVPRPLQTADCPRPDPGALTQSPASDTQPQPPVPGDEPLHQEPYIYLSKAPTPVVGPAHVLAVDGHELIVSSRKGVLHPVPKTFSEPGRIQPRADPPPRVVRRDSVGKSGKVCNQASLNCPTRAIATKLFARQTTLARTAPGYLSGCVTGFGPPADLRGVD